MSSTNDELPPPPKPRASPLDYRNTDLVSRLLAATPPYLYNMPLVPNSYFFSEMLRSFVQAKAENSARVHPAMHHRRSRKRSWTQSRTDYYHKESSPLEKTEMPSPPYWTPKPPPEKCFENRRADVPLELTKEKQCTITNAVGFNEIDIKNEKHPMSQRSESEFSPDKNEMNAPGSSPLLYPNMSQPLGGDSNPSNVILPPPPPIWYPPLYPTPYGIDPLHFFIDLRVSGHIYDRKNSKESSPTPISSPPSSSLPASQSHASITEQVSNNDKIQETEETKDMFKQSRHSSAFSVPTPSMSRNTPMNLSSDRYSNKENKSTKFDVISMGFDKSSNKTSTNYIMSNIRDIYKNLQNDECKSEIDNCEEKINISEQQSTEEGSKETEEEKEKKVKDLRALIGLELVVDYMNHAKPGQIQPSEESSSDLESSRSPTLEVVALHEEIESDL